MTAQTSYLHSCTVLIYFIVYMKKLLYKNCLYFNYSQLTLSRKLLSRSPSNLVCRVTYIEGTQCINFIKISLAVIEIGEVENSDLVVPVKNTLVHHMACLVNDT